MSTSHVRSLAQLAADPEFLGDAAFVGESYHAWRAFFAAVSGQHPEDGTAAELILECTGLEEFPSSFVREVVLLVGRRGGKGRATGFMAVYHAVVPEYRFAAGERGMVLVLAADRAQARNLFGYIVGFFRSSPLLQSMIATDSAARERVLSDSIELVNDVTIKVATASYRTIRGYTVVAAICDEMAFWKDDTSANPDVEVLAALRPAMSTIPTARLVIATSVYAKKGEAWNLFQRHYGRPGSVLVWKATTRQMNPTVSQAFIDEQKARDPARAAAEYESEFRGDVEDFLTDDAVNAVTDRDCRERARFEGASYVAFVDPAGGSGKDAMTLAIAHSEGGRAVLDLVREQRPPFSPEAVTRRFAEDLTRYGIAKVVGDRYAGEWPREAFRKHGIAYEPSDKSKSEIYSELLPMVNAQQCMLLNEPRLLGQLLALERRTSRGGRDSIDHPPHANDDVANAVAGVLRLAAGQSSNHCVAAIVEPDTSAFHHDYSGRLLRQARDRRFLGRRRAMFS